MQFILLLQCEERVVWYHLFLFYRVSGVGKIMVRGQEGLSLGCFPREGVLLCMHKSVWRWKH